MTRVQSDMLNGLAFLGVSGIAVAMYTHFTYSAPFDIAAHADSARDLWTEEHPPNFVYYQLLNWFSRLSGGQDFFYPSSILLLYVFFLGKVFISRHCIDALSQPEPGVLSSIVFVLACLLALALNLPNGLVRGTSLIGIPHPTSWHNSTISASAPFCILIFYVSYRYAVSQEARFLALTAGLSVLNLFIKPSYNFVFVLAFPVFYFAMNGLDRRSLWVVAVVALNLLIVQGQHSLIYETDAGSAVALSIFTVWAHYSDNIPLSLLQANLFQIAFLALLARRVRDWSLISYAGIGYGIALSMYALLIEVGPRATHGNFGWQVEPSLYVLFLAFLVELIRMTHRAPTFDRRLQIVWGIFALHVLAGIRYAGKVLLGGTWM